MQASVRATERATGKPLGFGVRGQYPRPQAPSTMRAVLVGRNLQRARLDDLIARARGGASAALIVHGEPGVGKTALLDSAAALARDFTLLRIQPLEAESELAFAGLADLVRPILHVLDRIPGPQQAALAGALALGPSSPGDRFAVAAATLSLLAVAAEDSPLLALADDAHWLDAPSREALLFAGRRLDREGVVLLFGMRERDWIEQAGLDALELRGLPAADASALLDSAGAEVAPTVRKRLIAETRGNPLALLEALTTLTDAQLRGSAPISDPLAVGASLERAFAEQLRGLPSETRRALLLAAASETGSAGEIGRALAQAGLPASALVPAEREGIVALGRERIDFRHPLVRSAAYHVADAAERRDAHRALATALRAYSGERAAWHLAAASTEPDEQVAALLERSAMDALARSAYAAAARAYEAAASLSSDDADRLRRTAEAGRALWLGGEPQRAGTLLESVLDLAVEPTARADLQGLRATAMLFTRPVSETYAMLLAEADRVEPHDPARAAALLTSAALTRFMAADHEHAAETVRRALRIGVEASAVSLLAESVLGTVHAIYGEVGEALAVIEPVLDHLLSVDPLSESPFALGGACQTFNWLERWDRARTLLDRVVGAARAAGAVAMLPFPLAVLAESELRLGRFATAYAAASESAQLAADTGQTVESAFSLVTLARVEAILGHEDECRTHVAAGLDYCRRTGATSIEFFGAAALGLLELSLGHADRAVVHLAECQRLEEEFDVRLPTIHRASADLVEARIRCGSRTEAERQLVVLERQAARTGLRWPAAMAARCRGLLADDGGYEQEFETALILHGADMPFERARTLLCLGMRRRRSRRRADARAALHAALASFDVAGAQPWAEQARAELRAAGDTAEPSGDRSVRSLTAQELQVALVVAKGATNREAAASLFLSPKTVEFHLGNAYRKLGLRSRAELVRRIEGLS
jgi:DNA-binding CsgD family transcriptional regulator